MHTQSCSTLCDPMDCSPLGSSVLGILQARILEWVAIPFSMGSSGPRCRILCLLHCRQAPLLSEPPGVYLIAINFHTKEKDISFVIQKERVSRKAIARIPSLVLADGIGGSGGGH